MPCVLAVVQVVELSIGRAGPRDGPKVGRCPRRRRFPWEGPGPLACRLACRRRRCLRGRPPALAVRARPTTEPTSLP